MNRPRPSRRTTLLAALGVATTVLIAPIAHAAPDRTDTPGDWVTAWSASPQGPSTVGRLGAEFFSGANQVKALQEIAPPPTTFSDQTIRQVMYLHQGGRAVRVELSNEFGDRDLTIPTTSVGIRAGDSGAEIEGRPVPITFRGEPSVTIPRGSRVLSDPVQLETDALDHLVVSMFVPHGQGAATVHGSSMQTFFVAGGDRVTDRGDDHYIERGVVADRITSTFTTASYYATGIQVEADSGSKTVVAIGDSITDGALSDGNTDGRYPDVLARRAHDHSATSSLSIINQAISGGRVTGDGVGPSVLNRLEADVLRQPNLGGVILLGGINDLGTTLFQGRPVTAEELIGAYREIAGRIGAAGVPVYIGTLTPSGNVLRPTPYGLYSTPGTVAERHRVNEWIRDEGRELFDGVIDFDQAVRDPLIPDWLALPYDSIDNLHPNQTGYRKMGQAVPARILREMAGG